MISENRSIGVLSRAEIEAQVAQAKRRRDEEALVAWGRLLSEILARLEDMFGRDTFAKA